MRRKSPSLGAFLGGPRRNVKKILGSLAFPTGRFHRRTEFIPFRRSKKGGQGEGHSGLLRCRVLAYCLLNNHFHLVLRPHNGGDLSRWMQYVERNPLRANLVNGAVQWPWSSLSLRVSGNRPGMLAEWPIACPANWLARVNRPQSKRKRRRWPQRSTAASHLGSRPG